MEELKHGSQSLQVLKDTLSRLPTTLEATYDQILSRIKDANALNAKKLLLWLAFAETPLLMGELAKIVEFDMESQRFNPDSTLHHPVHVLKICPSLVAEMEDGTVQLAHASIKEYICGKQRKIGTLLVLDSRMGHFFVGQCSLAYMLNTEEVCPDLSYHDDIPESSNKSLLKYSALFWPKHILACNGDLSVIDQIKKLFEPGRLMKWVKAYNYYVVGTQILYFPNHLQIAAQNGLIETVKWLLLKPATEMECMDALCAAAWRGDIKIVTLLFEKGLVSTSSYFYNLALEMP